jgi:hypothetical protein
MKPHSMSNLAAFFLVIMIVLSACGREHSNSETDITTTVTQTAPGVDISMTTVVWQGTISTYPDGSGSRTLARVLNCLSWYGYHRDGDPYVIMTDDAFNCGLYNGVLGCTDFSSDIIYVAWYAYRNYTTYSHELVHWVTRLGNDHHDDPVFAQCGQIFTR